MRKIQGLDTIKKNLTFSRDLLRRNEVKGLIAGTLLIKKESQMNVPVRQGNLRSSAFTVLPTGVASPGGSFKGSDAGELSSAHSSAEVAVQAEVAGMSGRNRMVGAIVYSAPYAIPVHENPNAGAAGYDPSQDTKSKTAKQVHSKVGGWKFLEKALNSSRNQVAKMLQLSLRFS